MTDARDRPETMDHVDHEPRLMRLEEGLAAGLDPDEGLRESLASCATCASEAVRMTAVAQRLREAASMLALDVEPSAAVRARVARAALGDGSAAGASAPVGRTSDAGVPGRRMPTGFFGRFAWAGAGSVVGALALAIALTLGDVTPPAAGAFTLTGSELAPGATGIAELRPLGNGSAAMTLRMRGLPRSKAGEHYELWWVGPEKRHVSCGTFRSDGSPVDLAFTSGVDVSTTVLIEITLEKDDGDPAPGPHVAQ